MDTLSGIMTTVLKEIFGELSGLSDEKQQVVASVIHALWAEENAEDVIHPEWHAELDRRNAQIESGKIKFVSETSMESFIDDLTADGN